MEQACKNDSEAGEVKETKSFSKINEDLIGTYLEKAKDRKSLFTEKLKNNNKPGLSLGQITAANSKAIRVRGFQSYLQIFFFNSAKNIKLRVFKNTTVSEVLRSAIETYLADP